MPTLNNPTRALKIIFEGAQAERPIKSDRTNADCGSQKTWCGLNAGKSLLIHPFYSRHTDGINCRHRSKIILNVTAIHTLTLMREWQGCSTTSTVSIRFYSSFTEETFKYLTYPTPTYNQITFIQFQLPAACVPSAESLGGEWGTRSRWGGGAVMRCRGGEQIEGDKSAGETQPRKKRRRKITKYEIERGDRRDPRLSWIQMDRGVTQIEEEERGRTKREVVWGEEIKECEKDGFTVG